MDEQEKLARARRQVAAIKGFYIHLLVFVLVNAFLVAINLTTGSEWWAQWPLLFWGVGLLIHGLAVWGGLSRAVARWEARKVEELKSSM